MSYFECAFLLLVIEFYSRILFANESLSLALTAASIVLVALSLHGTEWGKNEVKLIGAILLFSMAILFYTKGKLIIVPVILFMGMRQARIKRIIRVYAISSFICCIGIILANHYGMGTDIIVNRVRDGEILYRHSLGFLHPNQLFLSGIVTLFAFLYLYGWENRIAGIIGSLVVGGILYYITRCRAGFLSLSLILLILLFYPYMERKIEGSKILQFVIRNQFAIIGICVTVLTMFIWNMSSINLWSSNRFYYWKRIIDNISMIGIENFDGFLIQNKLILDSTYIYVLGGYGLATFILYAVLYHMAIKRLLAENMIWEILFICIFSIYGVMETLINPISNFSLLFILYALHMPGISREEKRDGFDYNNCSGIQCGADVGEMRSQHFKPNL